MQFKENPFLPLVALVSSIITLTSVSCMSSLTVVVPYRQKECLILEKEKNDEIHAVIEVSNLFTMRVE